ncbi:acyl-CoA thioesterase [Parapedobacter sp. ISTM3]|uniref:Acyl-CoA thioester hydrolase n=1 Tax=Parapedobacter luteus TaxID=623280 RepID=A0A1T5DTJ8_9SPHI|nr:MULTISPECIES: acyl-CoA thioesterase [Parapedobacter]MBK1440805.1 acyl-CoA thioesterase [Parapedobacter sp. ISTM3]SKB75142.1 acyl-CoA thioester hydrolase [Parapedobacter luteus]
MTQQLQHTTRFRVRFNETDPLGIVWHGHYVTYFEDGREAFGEAFGISYRYIRDEGFLAPVVKCVCEYKSPLRHGDWADVETVFVASPAAKMTFRYTIFNAARQVVATGETIQVFTDMDGELILTNPPFFADWKAKHGL